MPIRARYPAYPTSIFLSSPYRVANGFSDGLLNAFLAPSLQIWFTAGAFIETGRERGVTVAARVDL